MPGWYGEFMAESSVTVADRCRKSYEEGKISYADLETCIGESQAYYLYGKARSDREKEQGVLGNLKEAGQVAVGTIAGYLTGGPVGAIGALAGTAKALKSQGMQSDVKRVEQTVKNLQASGLVPSAGGVVINPVSKGGDNGAVVAASLLGVLSLLK